MPTKAAIDRQLQAHRESSQLVRQMSLLGQMTQRLSFKESNDAAGQARVLGKGINSSKNMLASVRSNMVRGKGENQSLVLCLIYFYSSFSYTCSSAGAGVLPKDFD
jgi:hypothetical protein